MTNANTTLIDRAEEAGVSLATYSETRGHLQRGVRQAELPRHAIAKRFVGTTPQSFAGFPCAAPNRHGSVDPSPAHIPGDTRTPPAPGAVRIGPEDV